LCIAGAIKPDKQVILNIMGVINMAEAYVRHMFAGNNTSRGFYSYFDYILPQDEAGRIFIIKGGPGVGKSTFMKHMAKEFANKGYALEFIHCSSDPESLDALVVPALKVAIIDGTSPHIIDPKTPGAIDEIVNFGDYWDEAGISKSKNEILKENAYIGRLFKRAYRYLAAAAIIQSDNAEIAKLAVDRQRVLEEAENIIERFFSGEKAAKTRGSVRKLFATAITPQGLKGYTSSLFDTKHLIVLKGDSGTGTEDLLERVKEAALLLGYHVEAFYCALLPEKLEHIIIPGKELSITTSNKYHPVVSAGRQVIDLNEYLDQHVMKENKDEYEYNRLEFEGLLNRAIMTIEHAKRVHDHMEDYYKPHMNFDLVEDLKNKVLAKILDT